MGKVVNSSSIREGPPVNGGFSPTDLGLAYPSWRNNQLESILEAAEWVAHGDSQTRVQTMETGFGKSLVYVALVLLHGGRACVVTASKGLQEQLIGEHGSLLSDIRGRSNYTCKAFPWSNCEESSPVCKYRATNMCSYKHAYKKALKSNLVLTNYSYFFNVHRHGLGLGKFDLLIFDEGQHIFDEVAGCLEVGINQWDVARTTPIPRSKTAKAWADWASTNLPTISSRIVHLDSGAESVGGDARTLIKERHRLSILERKLITLRDITPKDWSIHVDDVAGEMTAEPVFVHTYTPTLWRPESKVLMYSATLVESQLQMLNVLDTPVHYYPSDFDHDRNPFYWVPTTRVDRHMSPEARNLWRSRGDQIISTRLDRKGIFHTVSFIRRDEILYGSRFSRWMISNHDSRKTSVVVNDYRSMPPPVVLVSPSVNTGYNFPFDECRYAILGKVPFPDSSREVIQRRQHAYPGYSDIVTMQSLIQTHGRGRRSKKDFCESLMLDDHIDWFLKYKSQHATPGFMECVRRVRAIPPPPRLEDL